MEGYQKIAHLMGVHSDLMMLRRFRALNAENLLYYQAELVHLEADMHELARRDAGQPGREFAQRDWWSLAHGGVEKDTEHWELILNVREKLEKYNDAILKYVALLRLDSPSSHDAQLLKSWFERPQMGAFPLLGLDRDAWDCERKELVALKPRPRENILSRWFIDRLVPKGHRCLGHRIKNPVGGNIGSDLYEYKETTLNKIVDLFTTVVASLLPLVSVVVLYFIERNSLRIGVIIALSACFSFALAVTTNARKIEIFAATSAFAAVNVVYLTNSISCPNVTSS